MRLDKSRRSKNVEDRTRDTSATAFKSNPKKNPAIQRVIAARNKEYDEFGRGAIKKTKKTSATFKDMHKGMDKAFKKAKRNPRKNTRTPIPTPRPDPRKK